MGVELQHCAVYGYRFDGRFPWDEMHRNDNGELADRLMDYDDHDAEEGDFVLYQDPRGGDYCIAGIVHFLTDSTRWHGPQHIDVTVMEEPAEELVEAMEQTIDEEFGDYVERKTDEPEHIVFTHNW